MTRPSVAEQAQIGCHTCYKISSAGTAHCPRCHSPLHVRKRNSLQHTLALLITASLLYIPANVFPIMTTTQFGQGQPNTILGGIMLLVEAEAYPVATIIFLASVIIPLAKLFALFYLCWAVTKNNDDRLNDTLTLKTKTQLYRMAEFMGKWSMVDVFVVAILVALIQIQGLMSVEPGVAGVAFSGVVIVTMLAAESFDPRLIWDRRENYHE
jgi:paraquat-inducible protein A